MPNNQVMENNIYKPELNITTPHLLSKWSFDNHEKVNGANIN